MNLQLGQMPAPNGTAAPQSGQFGQGVSGVERSVAVPASQTGAPASTGEADRPAGGTYEAAGPAGGTYAAAGTGKHASRNARARSPADANRSFGSLTSARATTSATDFGRSGRASRSDGAGSCKCCSSTPIGVSATNGRSPTSISYSTTPRAYTSERWSIGSP